MEIWVELAALGVAVWAAAKSVPRPPARDWERLFKVALATVIRGEVEAAGGDVAAWRGRVVGRVLYHPGAGTRPELKLLDPASVKLPVPPLELERGLTEALAKLPDPAARFRRMYVDDPAVEAALLEHPEALGDAYDPGRGLGPKLDWDAVAAWTPPLQEALARRLEAVVLVDLGADLGGRLAAAVPGLRHATVSPDDTALASTLLAQAPAASDRLALLVRGPAVRPTLRALESSMVLRDRVVAVLAIGAPLQATEQDQAWMAEHFRHDRMDPELNHAVPYAAVLDVAPDGSDLSSWAGMRFPVPPEVKSGRHAIDAIDLGPLVLRELPPDAVARAIGVTLAFYLSS